MTNGRRTKIIATLGPASWDPPRLRELIEVGVDVFRLNFSHGTPEKLAELVSEVRAMSDEVGREVALLGDLPGPKLRVGSIAGDIVELETGSHVLLTPEDIEGTASEIPVSWPAMTSALHPKEVVYLADGAIRLRVRESDSDGVECDVEVGGTLSSHKGMNLPGADTGLPAVSDEDLGWIDFACEHGIDILAVSFVRRAADLEPVTKRLGERGSDIPLIAKIEKPQAAASATQIIEAATGIMVARGDLGIELPLSRVPIVQKDLIREAGRCSKPVITATQMLASMVTARRPTRAEVTDVANAIYDGTDAVMLSEETAVGQNPVEAVRVMDQIARQTEPDLPYQDWLFNRTDQRSDEVADSVAQFAVASAYRLGLAALVVPSSSGRTARIVSAHRPRVPVLTVSPRRETVRRVKLLFGVQSTHLDTDEDIRVLLDNCADIAKREGVASSGDLIGIVAGLPDQELGTNLFEVHRVP